MMHDYAIIMVMEENTDQVDGNSIKDIDRGCNGYNIDDTATCGERFDSRGSSSRPWSER